MVMPENAISTLGGRTQRGGFTPEGRQRVGDVGRYLMGTGPFKDQLEQSISQMLQDFTGYSGSRRFMQEAMTFNPVTATIDDYVDYLGRQSLNLTETALAGADLAAVAPLAKPIAQKAYTGLRQLSEQVPAPGIVGGRLAGEEGMVAWHGSPHKFPPTERNPLGEFDLGKMGTGEGAQAYGHGTYLAEGKETGKFYQEALSKAHPDDAYKAVLNTSQREGWELSGREASWLEPSVRNQKGTQETLEDFFEAFPEWKGVEGAEEGLTFVINKSKEQMPKGHLYEVDLPDEEIAKMLDWDKPLSEQSEYVRDRLEKSGVPYPDKDWNTGQKIYEQSAPKGKYTSRTEQEAAASQYLNELGIPGIKYLDATSRGAGEGTRNFVLFDPQKAKIVGRK
jgi:hypothetical protein